MEELEAKGNTRGPMRKSKNDVLSCGKGSNGLCSSTGYLHSPTICYAIMVAALINWMKLEQVQMFDYFDDVEFNSKSFPYLDRATQTVVANLQEKDGMSTPPRCKNLSCLASVWWGVIGWALLLYIKSKFSQFPITGS